MAIKNIQPTTQLYFGIALTRKDRPDEAFAAFRAAIFLEPTNAEAYKEIAAPLVAKGRHDEAVTNLLYALKLEPGYWEAREELSKLTNSVPALPPAGSGAPPP